MGNKILLADDSITIQKVIELTFSDEDFEVVTVGNGRLAIEKVQEVRPDVVLCDVIMPEKDGYEVCDFVKKSPALAHIPVLLLTGAFEPFDQERAARVGCDGFLAKPFEPETLIARVKDLLAKATAQKNVVRPATASLPPMPEAAPPMVTAPTQAPPIPFAPVPAHSIPSAPFAPEPLSAPAYVAAAAPIEPEVAFIPDEPFEDLGSPVYPEAVVPPLAAVTAPQPVVTSGAPAEAIEELVPISPEESESLAAPSEGASTVMFRADSLPWAAPAPPAPAPAPAAWVQAPAPVFADPAPPPVPEAPSIPEPAVFEPEHAVFEEVIEEDDGSSTIIMSSPPVFEPPPPPPRPEPPAPPPPAPLLPVPFAAPFEAHVPPPVMAPAPPPPAPAPEPRAWAPPPPVFAAAAPPVFAAPPPPAPVFVPSPPEPVARMAEAPAESSFADVATAIAPEAKPERPSISAEVDVPVDMVAQIAQRVVAQVSEKMVERIAWEVIPDLAEALIKREIERLKAELKQLS